MDFSAIFIFFSDLTGVFEAPGWDLRQFAYHIGEIFDEWRIQAVFRQLRMRYKKQLKSFKNNAIAELPFCRNFLISIADFNGLVECYGRNFTVFDRNSDLW